MYSLDLKTMSYRVLEFEEYMTMVKIVHFMLGKLKTERVDILIQSSVSTFRVVFITRVMGNFNYYPGNYPGDFG